MGYPNPLTVRTVKNVLKDGMYEAGLYGAASVVDALIGTFWGSLFTRSNRRDYLNFLGELAGRVITGDQRKIASNVYAYENLYTNTSGKPAIKVPAKQGEGYYYNRDGAIRQNGHTYDSVDYESRDRIVGSTFNMNNNRYHKPHNNNNQPKKHNNVPAPVKHPGNMSVLEDAINDMCRVSYDFSISSFFQKVKDKLLSLIGRTPDKKQAGKDVLQGCYEFLEEQGQDGYTILVNILTSHETGRNFSEVTPDTEKEFKDAILLYSGLDDAGRQAFLNSLQIACGKDEADLTLSTLQKGSEGVTIPKSIVRVMKVLGLLTISLGILRFIFRDRKTAEEETRVPIT